MDREAARQAGARIPDDPARTFFSVAALTGIIRGMSATGAVVIGRRQ